MTTGRKLSSVLLFIALPILLAVMVYSKLNQYQPFGTAYLSPKVPSSSEISFSGRSLADFKGKAVLVFFGFLHCPDVCPTTMLDLSKVYQSVPESEKERVQVVFVSVDPQRDNQEDLSKYVKAFDPSFEGLVGNEDQTREIAKSFAVYYEKTGDTTGDAYDVQHTSSVFGLDPSGRLRVVYGSEAITNSKRIAQDLSWLLK